MWPCMMQTWKTFNPILAVGLALLVVPFCLGAGFKIRMRLEPNGNNQGGGWTVRDVQQVNDQQSHPNGGPKLVLKQVTQHLDQQPQPEKQQEPLRAQRQLHSSNRVPHRFKNLNPFGETKKSNPARNKAEHTRTHVEQGRQPLLPLFPMAPMKFPTQFMQRQPGFAGNQDGWQVVMDTGGTPRGPMSFPGGSARTMVAPLLPAGGRKAPMTMPRHPFSGNNAGNRKGSEYIVGGQTAILGQFPYQALLAVFDGCKESFATFCGGSLISPKWVLSAAHCLCNPNGGGNSKSGKKCEDQKDFLKKVVVVLGDYNRSELFEKSEQWFRVKRVVMHKDWEDWFPRRSVIGDVMLMMLHGEAQLNTFVQPIKLPKSRRLAAYGEAIVSGWGTMSEGARCPPDLLQYVRVPIVDIDECISAYKIPGAQWGEGINRKAHVCAGYLGIGGKDSCQGDSGGPLACREPPSMETGNEDEVPEAIAKPYLCGVVSFGKGCGDAEYPGVYSNVAYYVPWIKKVMATPGPECPHSECDPVISGSIYTTKPPKDECDPGGSGSGEGIDGGQTPGMGEDSTQGPSRRLTSGSNRFHAPEMKSAPIIERIGNDDEDTSFSEDREFSSEVTDSDGVERERIGGKLRKEKGEGGTEDENSMKKKSKERKQKKKSRAKAQKAADYEDEAY